jgi:uncharacterized protein YcfJ
MKPITMTNPTPYDNMTTMLTIGTVVFGAITHWTANGIAAFFTIVAGATAAIYNSVKIYEWYQKQKDIHRYQNRSRKNKTP